MTRLFFVCVLICTAVAADARPAADARKHQPKSKSPILSAVQKNPVLRLHFVKGKRGKQIPVITNVYQRKRVGRDIRESQWQEISWPAASISRVPASGTRLKTVAQSDFEPITSGIPVPPNRHPQRAINPLKVVNPFRDPTAIPASQAGN